MGPDEIIRTTEESLGTDIAREMYNRGMNPWDLARHESGVARDISDAYRLPPGSLNIKEIPRGYTQKGQIIMGGFQAPSRMGTIEEPRLREPFNPLYTEVFIDEEMTPAEKLLSLRHEIEHAKDYYRQYHQYGPRGLEVGKDTHFLSGEQDEVEPSFVNRPWMLPR